MDNKLVIQLLTSKAEEIQSLLTHLTNEPKDLYDGIELLESRIQGLSQDFKLLKRNCTPKINQITISTEAEKTNVIATERLTNRAEADLKTEKTTIVVAEPMQSTDTINEELPIIENVINEKQIIEDKRKIEKLIVAEEIQNEPIQLIGEKTPSQKLIDIQSAIGINDRFLFTRELFENNIDKYNAAISFVNETDKFESVLNWIKSEKEWDLEAPTVTQFIEITKRKF